MDEKNQTKLPEETLDSVSGGINIADDSTKRFKCDKCEHRFEKYVSPLYRGNVQKEAQDDHDACGGTTGSCKGTMKQQL